MCVQCVRDRCYSSFHVTCAQYRGLLSEDLKDRSGLVCHKHYLTQVLTLCHVGASVHGVCCVQEEQGAVEIVTGEEVYIEQAGGVLSGRVTEVGSQTQYEVAFEDGSVCSNLSTADILVGPSVYVPTFGVILLLHVYRTHPAPLPSRAVSSV